MKTVITQVVALLIAVSSFAQINGINYKAVIKDNSGNSIANDLIQVNFSILQGAAQTNIYEESHTPTTDANGMIILNIGEGTVISGDFNIIDWGSDDHFLNVMVNIGNGLVDLGTTQFKTVPYAYSVAPNSHNHLGELWNNSTDGLQIFVNDANDGALRVGNSGENGNGLQVTSTGGDGILIAFAGLSGLFVNDAGNDGVLIGSAAGDGLQVGNAGVSGVFIQSAGAEGVFVQSADTDGFRIGSAGDDGLEIGTAVDDGININATGGNGVSISSAGNNGIGINLAANDGINIGTTNANGIFVSYAGQNGVFISSAANYGGYFRGATSGILAQSSNGDNPDIILGGFSGNDDGIISSDPSFPGSDIFLKSNDAVVIQVDQNNAANGDFQIRDGLDTVVFRVTENGVVQQNGSTIHASDKRLKKDITELPYGLKEVLQLQPKAYHWKDRETEHKSLGLIAQDVQPIIKEIVTAKDNEEKTLGISYTELIPVLINAMQEQNKKIEALEARLDSQETNPVVRKD